MLNILPQTREIIKENRRKDGVVAKRTRQKLSSKQKKLMQLLRYHGLRPTKQRMVIAAHLLDGEKRHVSAETLYRQIATTGAEMSLATIYNSLRHFVDAGLIHAVATCGSKQWFCVDGAGQGRPAATGCHCQFYFDDSHRAEPLHHGGVDFSTLPAAPEGYEISRIDVAIHLTKKPAVVLSS